MRHEKEIEIIRTNEEPVEDGRIKYFILTNACASDTGEVEEFELALEEDLRAVSSRVPGSVDPRVLLVATSDSECVRLRAKAPYESQKALRFWSEVRFPRCNELSGKWFSQRWNGRKEGGDR